MKKQYLLLIALFTALNSYVYAQTGTTCNNAIPITSLPYQTMDNTKNYLDLVDGPQISNCIANNPNNVDFMAGNDAFYSYTPTESGVISIRMTPTKTHSGIFVLGSCPKTDSNTTCLSGVADFDLSTRTINNFSVTAGTTYTFVVSSSANTQTFDYSLLIQKENCTPPVGLETSQSDITKTSADLKWTNPSLATSWEVAVQTFGSLVPSGAGITVTKNTFTATNLITGEQLVPGTQYQYWVRSKCDENTFSSWSGPYLFNTEICNDTDKCTYLFRMSSSYVPMGDPGKGWNGATMQVKQNGIVVATIGSTFTSGIGPIDIPVKLCKNTPFELFWSNAGTAPGWARVSVINSFSQTIFTNTNSTVNPGNVLYGNVANCDKPQCDITPMSLSVTAIDGHGATLNWVANATTSWDIYVVPSNSPVPGVLFSPEPTASTAPTYAGVTSNSFVINNLLQNTFYQFYVRVACSPTPGPWSDSSMFLTLTTCPYPTNSSVSGIKSTGATFNWTKGTSTDNLWEILLVKGDASNNDNTPKPSFNPILTNGDILTTVNTSAPYTMTGLTAGTTYYYYIRTVCSGNEKSLWSNPVKLSTPICDQSDKCTYTFIQTDSGNNGWEGNLIQVRQNGMVVATLGMTSGGSATKWVDLCKGVPFDLFWSASGNKPEEICLKVISPFNEIIYTKIAGEGISGTTLYASTGTCTVPACSSPTMLTATNVTQSTAALGWTQLGSVQQWEVYVMPTGAVAPVNGTPVSGVTPYYIATTNPFIITGLQPSTSYTYYVRALCSDTDASAWTILSPKTFMTKPSNDECTTAISVPVNATNDLLVKASGNTFEATASSPATSPVCQGASDDDVWFSFVATATTHVISLKNITGTSTDLSHTLYSGSDCGSLTQLYCSDPNVSVVKNLIIGNTYKIRVYTNFPGQSASFDVYITTPPPVTNDECTSAVTLTVNSSGCSASTPGTITTASASPQANTCIGLADDDVWYKFVANSTTQYVSLLGSTTNVNHAVYTGNCNALSLKYCSTANSLISNAQDFVVGDTYYVRVWSNSNVPQDVTFDICIGKTTNTLTIDNPQYTINDLVKNVLVKAPCMAVSNISSSPSSGIGYFNRNDSSFPLKEGMIIRSGVAKNTAGAYNNTNISTVSSGTTDADLKAINTANGNSGTINDASFVKFNFIAGSADFSFRYLFASNEYGQYQCGYSDAFAFILKDETAGTPAQNLALVPGTNTAVSVTSIRDNKYNVNCASVNSKYFDQSNETDPTKSAINMKGQSKLMTASSPVIPGHTYSVKMVIGDYNDSSFDSAVFIEAASFTSGPPECMDKIKLVAFADTNANGVQDSGEKNFTYGSYVLQKNNTGTPTTISASNGSYTLYESDPTNVYDFSFQINPEYADYYAATATNFNDINIPAGSGTTSLYIPITVTQGYKDVSVTVIPVSEPIPGGSYVNKIVYKNSGTIPASGTIAFIKPDASTITNIGQSGTVQNMNGFTYDFTALAPNESRTFDVTMSVPANASIGDILTCTATISAAASKGIGSVVTSTNSQTIVPSFASSRISESHSQKIPFNSFSTDDYLTYTIRFQNVGTANATSVRIEDVLNSKVDINSLRMISASHNYVSEIVGSKIVWHMDYINLVGAPQNEELSKGYITFKVKLLSGFAAGDIIPNHADIYFDSNDAVTTNSYNTEFTAPLGVETFEAEDIQLFPNPASNMVNIRLQNSIETLDSITIYDLTGKMIEKVSGIAANQSSLSVGSLAKGMYLVEITTQSKMKTTKKLIVN